jgi:hypothetical protein
MKIRYSTTAEGKVDWVGDTILYPNIQYSMSQIQNMIHTLVEKARRVLIEDLIMVELNIFGEVNMGQVPAIDWAGLRDNMAEDKVGWSFLQDIRNRFSVDGQWWLWNRVYKKEWLRRQFVAPEQPEG